MFIFPCDTLKIFQNFHPRFARVMYIIISENFQQPSLPSSSSYKALKIIIPRHRYGFSLSGKILRPNTSLNVCYVLTWKWRITWHQSDTFYTTGSQQTMAYQLENYFHENILFNSFIRYINSNTKLMSIFSQEIFLYDLVGNYDMPVYRWRKATNFLFNYTPIFRSAALFEGMMKYENYIRWFSKEVPV